MKATKKIVGAACALVAAVALSAGSTFAWFASNNSVKASGLKLTVNTSSSYLIIGNSAQSKVSDIRAEGGKTETTFTASASKLTPVAHETLTSTTVDKVSSEDGLWYTQVADAPNSSASSGAKTKITNMTGYVLTDCLYFSVKAGSGDSGALSVQAVEVKKDGGELSGNETVKPVSVIFVCGANLVEYKFKGAVWDKVGESSQLATTVKDSTLDSDLVRVDVYVYYDGENTEVYSDNATNLVGAEISVSFSTADPE